MLKLFISHINEEAPLALKLKEWIETTFLGKCEVFVSSDADDVPAGTKWFDEIERALDGAAALIVLCSPSSLTRPWINFETGCGWMKRIPIIPLCHSGQEKSALPQPIARFQALDISAERSETMLIDALAIHFGFTKSPRIDTVAMRRELEAARLKNSAATFQPSKVIAPSGKNANFALRVTSAHWGSYKQPDSTYSVQINVRFVAKNKTSTPIALISGSITRPRIEGEVTHALVMLRAPKQNMYGSADASGHRLPGNMSLPGTLDIMIRRDTMLECPTRKTPARFKIFDDDGNFETLQVDLVGYPKAKKPEPLAPEHSFEIDDPIEKDLVSVLESELHRYANNGRSCGGLGSIHLAYQGRVMNSFGATGRQANVPRQQSIAPDADCAEIKSDNLNALHQLNLNLPSDDERDRLAVFILNRIGKDRGYVKISYFLIYALFQMNRLGDALNAAKDKLERDDNVHFGIGNILMLLDGLLRYRHIDFSPKNLDDIQAFIFGLDDHSFEISEKIADIRARRLQGEIAYIEPAIKA